MSWMLTICIGVSWAGCGSYWAMEYPNEESCYRALAAMKTDGQPVAESEKRRSSIAACSPKGPRKNQ